MIKVFNIHIWVSFLACLLFYMFIFSVGIFLYS